MSFIWRFMLKASILRSELAHKFRIRIALLMLQVAIAHSNSILDLVPIFLLYLIHANRCGDSNSFPYMVDVASYVMMNPRYLN